MQPITSKTSFLNTTPTPAMRITHAFTQAKHEGRGTLIPYFMCGYPTASQSIELILAAAQGGADMIELGVPFSDPLADGATIQHAGHIALEGGMTINGCMAIAHQVSLQSNVPLIFMGYYNPIIAYGIERFCQTAAASGVCGLIIPDLPLEESTPLQRAAQQHGISLVFLVSPTTPNERIEQIVKTAANEAGSFIYCISLSGITGARTELPSHLHSFIERVRNYTKDYSLPIAVGFGLSTPQHIAYVTSYADGAIVGSALVKLIEQNEQSKQTEAVKHYIMSLRQNPGC